MCDCFFALLFQTGLACNRSHFRHDGHVWSAPLKGVGGGKRWRSLHHHVPCLFHILYFRSLYFLSVLSISTLGTVPNITTSISPHHRSILHIVAHTSSTPASTGPEKQLHYFVDWTCKNRLRSTCIQVLQMAGITTSVCVRFASVRCHLYQWV